MIPESSEKFETLVREWMRLMDERTIEVNVSKPNGVDGMALKVTKPYPALLDNFMLYACVNSDQWGRIRNDPKYSKYEEWAQIVTDYCNASIMTQVALGYISDGIGKFYLVNNSRYKDVSEVVQTKTVKVLPAWITTKVQIGEQETPKALPHESIPFTEVVQKTPISIDDLV